MYCVCCIVYTIRTQPNVPSKLCATFSHVSVCWSVLIRTHLVATKPHSTLDPRVYLLSIWAQWLYLMVWGCIWWCGTAFDGVGLHLMVWDCIWWCGSAWWVEEQSKCFFAWKIKHIITHVGSIGTSSLQNITLPQDVFASSLQNITVPQHVCASSLRNITVPQNVCASSLQNITVPQVFYMSSSISLYGTISLTLHSMVYNWRGLKAGSWSL